MVDALRLVLESGLLTDEQCLSILRGLDFGEALGGCKSEEIIRLDNRKSLTELLDMRNLSDDESYLLARQVDQQYCCNSLTEYYEQSEPEDERYRQQIAESQCFDIDRDVLIPRVEGMSPFYFGEKEEQPPPEMVLYGRLGVHWFNFQQNRNLKFIRIPKLNTEYPFSICYYITVEVEDVDDAAAAAANSSPSLTLQTMVRRAFFPRLEVEMECCRIKPTTAEAAFLDHFEYYGVPVFYRECMPTFLSEKSAADGQSFYEVQDEDIEKNDWLLLYAHFALFQVCEAGSHSFLPEEMELKKILVQTRDTEPSPILKSLNAIFHISFRANCRDYTSVVRRTTDGMSGHMRLEVHTR